VVVLLAAVALLLAIVSFRGQQTNYNLYRIRDASDIRSDTGTGFDLLNIWLDRYRILKIAG
jgi:hypothetical protein